MAKSVFFGKYSLSKPLAFSLLPLCQDEYTYGGNNDIIESYTVVPTPEVPEQPVQPAEPQTPVLPNTGTESSTAAVLAGAIAGLLARKKKED